MLLMIFINAVVLFHTHPTFTAQSVSCKNTPSHYSSNFQYLGTSHTEHCPICDFRLSKDADLVETLMFLSPLSHTNVIGTPKLPVYFSALQSISSDRAPPVL